MITETSWNGAVATLLFKHDIDYKEENIRLGVVQYSQFTPDEIDIIKERYPELYCMEIYSSSGVEFSDAFMGAGISVLFVEEKFYIFPEHYMNDQEILKFILTILKQHHPDKLI